MKCICLLAFLFCVSMIEQKVFGQPSRSYVTGNFSLTLDNNSGGWIRKEGNTLVFKVLNAKDTTELRRRNQKIITEAKLPYIIRFDIDPAFKPKRITPGPTDPKRKSNN